MAIIKKLSKPKSLDELLTLLPETWYPTIMRMRGGWSCVIIDHTMGKTIGTSCSIFPSPSEAVVAACKSAKEYEIRHPKDEPPFELVPLKGDDVIPDAKLVKKIIKKKP